MSGESEESDEASEQSDDEQDSLCVILADEKRSYHGRELQTDLSPGTYNLEYYDGNGGQKLKMIAVSRKPFREL